ncbi:MAG: hypothetical protein H6729_06870 [Deltaproteobacteria bacterium]|nr:hypothetical protein [Deltaproteobacteria bacterium]
MDWNFSFRAFRLFGTEVRIHWSLPAFCIYYVLRATQHSTSPTFLLLFVLLPIVLLFASVIAHEFGHVFAAAHYGMPTGHMVLTPIGGMVMVSRSRSPKMEFVIAFCGPLVNAALAALGLVAYVALGGPLDASLLFPFLGHDAFATLWLEHRLAALVAHDFIQTNAGLFWFNMLLVAYPLDGGRILLSWLWYRRGFQRGLVLACKIARVIAALIGVVALVSAQPTLGIIAFFVFFQAHQTLSQAHLIPDPSGGMFRPAPHNGASGHRSDPNSPNGLITRFGQWREARREHKVRALLARAELNGLASLSDADRRFLKRVREAREPPRR